MYMYVVKELTSKTANNMKQLTINKTWTWGMWKGQFQDKGPWVPTPQTKSWTVVIEICYMHDLVGPSKTVHTFD